MGITPEIVTDDLHASIYKEGNVETEYESHFVALGKNIHMLEVRRAPAPTEQA